MTLSQIMIFDRRKFWKRKQSDMSRISRISTSSDWFSNFLILQKKRDWSLKDYRECALTMILQSRKIFFTKMLYHRKIVLIWTFKKMRRLRSKMISSIKTRTIEHKTWQHFEFHISRAFMRVVSKMIRNRMKTKILEYCYESYRNSWFLVKKKKKEKYKIINAIFEMNKMIIRNVNLLSSIDEFFEKFADCVMFSLIDFFSKYDQVAIDVIFRDMIVFMIFIELVCQTSLLMKIINSVVKFVKIINRILEDLIFKIARQFVNDLNVKKSKIWYNHEEILSEIRKAIMKHVQNLNRMFAVIERVEETVFEKKSQFCFSNLKIVDYICDCEDRHSNTIKIIKTLNWSSCQDLNDARDFLRICVYYRIWIEEFVVIAAFIYFLFNFKRTKSIWNCTY